MFAFLSVLLLLLLSGMYAQPCMDSEVLQRAGMMEPRGVFILRKDDDVF